MTKLRIISQLFLKETRIEISNPVTVRIHGYKYMCELRKCKGSLYKQIKPPLGEGMVLHWWGLFANENRKVISLESNENTQIQSVGHIAQFRIRNPHQ